MSTVPQERADQDEGDPYRRHYPPAQERAPGTGTDSTRRSSRQRRRRDEDSLLGDFYRRIETSRDRLFLIMHEPAGTTVPQWHLVQVDIDDTDPLRAKRLGEYQCNFLISHSKDAAMRPTRECRFWPELRALKSDGSLGKQIEVAPGKVASFLHRNPSTVQYSDRISLSENRIAGPFNFENRVISRNQVRGLVPEGAWKELEEAGPERGIDISNLGRIVRRRR